MLHVSCLEVTAQFQNIKVSIFAAALIEKTGLPNAFKSSRVCALISKTGKCTQLKVNRFDFSGKLSL